MGGTKELHGKDVPTGKWGRSGSISPIEFDDDSRIPYLRKGERGAASGGPKGTDRAGTQPKTK